MKKLKLILGICSFSFCVQAQSPKVFTYSDTSGARGYTPDGTHISASLFSSPSGLCFDPDGNLYVVDFINDVIRKIDTFGIVTTVVGNGTAGFGGDGGPASAAQISRPYNITFDTAGNLYIADRNNQRVRKVDKKTNIISTIAGLPTAPSRGDGGPAINAKFLLGPMDIAFDKLDNLYISEARCIRMVTPGGIISTIAGDTTLATTGILGFGDGGPALKAKFNGAWGLSIDANNNIYIAENVFNTVRRVSRSKNIFHFAGVGGIYSGFIGDGGPAKLGYINSPHAICNDNAGNLFVTDNLCRIRMITKSTGIINTIAGTGMDRYNGDGLDALLTNVRPFGLAFDKRHNILYYTDGNRIRKITGLPAVADQDPDEIDEEDKALTIIDTEQESFSIFPNPVGNELSIQNLSTATKVSITDLLGKVVLDHQLQKGSKSIDVSSLSSGSYLLLMQEKGSSKKTVLKFIKN